MLNSCSVDERRYRRRHTRERRMKNVELVLSALQPFDAGCEMVRLIVGMTENAVRGDYPCRGNDDYQCRTTAHKKVPPTRRQHSPSRGGVTRRDADDRRRGAFSGASV